MHSGHEWLRFRFVLGARVQLLWLSPQHQCKDVCAVVWCFCKLRAAVWTMNETRGDVGCCLLALLFELYCCLWRLPLPVQLTPQASKTHAQRERGGEGGRGRGRQKHSGTEDSVCENKTAQKFWRRILPFAFALLVTLLFVCVFGFLHFLSLTGKTKTHTHTLSLSLATGSFPSLRRQASC